MPNNKPESKLIRAAGAVAWRPDAGGEPEILLVHRTKYDDWSLPKGKTEPGEQLPVTAVREVLEEGGAHLALGRRLVSVRYNVGGRPKRVHYWAARVTSTDVHAVPNSEVDQIDWVPAARAVERVSYAHDHSVLADFAAHPARTVPLILLRHAKAVGKSDWKRGDVRRPLDDSGRAHAKALAELLACFAPRARVITSPAARCVETIRPFAERVGAEPREEPSLYIHNQSWVTGPADSGPSIAALMEEAIASGEPTVLCAHRENIPALQAAALAALGVGRADGGAATGDALLDDAHPGVAELSKEWDALLPTAGFWVLNVIPAPTPPASPQSAFRPASVPSAPASSGPVPPVLQQPALRPASPASQPASSASQPSARQSAPFPPETPPAETAPGEPPVPARRGRLRRWIVRAWPARKAIIREAAARDAITREAITGDAAPRDAAAPDAAAPDAAAREATTHDAVAGDVNAPDENATHIAACEQADPAVASAAAAPGFGQLISADRYDLSET